MALCACERRGVSHCTEFAPNDQRTLTFSAFGLVASVQFRAVVTRQPSQGLVLDQILRRATQNVLDDKQGPCFDLENGRISAGTIQRS